MGQISHASEQLQLLGGLEASQGAGQLAGIVVGQRAGVWI
jgi:hypothetical protein